jgi:hypothetical protein
MGDPADLSEFSLQIVSVEQVRADGFHARRQRRGATRPAVDLGVGEGGRKLGRGAAAHSVDTCNQNDVLYGHLFPSRRFVVFLAIFIRSSVAIRNSKT